MRTLPWLILLLLIPACGGGSLRVDSVSGAATLRTDLPTRVYAAGDRNTADFYLTDLPPEAWSPDADFSAASGSLVHVHMFIAPRAGRTPIDNSASNITIRYFVIANGRAGLYAGGGFLHQSGASGDSAFGGRLKHATLRLIRATPGFTDRLGPCELSGSFSAAKDPGCAAELSALVQSFLLALPEREPGVTPAK